MRSTIVLSMLASLMAVNALTISPSSSAPPSPSVSQTYQLHTPQVTFEAVEAPEQQAQEISSSEAQEPTLAKRWKKVHNPKTTTSTSELPPEPWIRTISSTVVEIVHPTVIAGVTFSAKPTEHVGGGPTRWVSLNKQGRPKTINPQVKNGVTKNASPDYKTYFKTATTIVHDNKDLKAHNLGKGETFTDVKWIEEDDTYTSLNPIIRCTPDRYFNKGLGKDVKSEPFCTPVENSNIDLGKAYFVTWFTKYFEGANKVRLHLAYIKESAKAKGFKKRDLNNSVELETSEELIKREEDALYPSGTKLAFFTSEWIENRDGYFPLEVNETWLKGKYDKAAIITIQPDTVEDEDFDLLSNGIIVKLRKQNAVYKKTKARLDDGIGENENKYIVLMTIPTVVVIAACFMYFLTQFCSGDRDVASIRRAYYKSKFHKVVGKPKLFGKKKGKKGYSNLPQFEEHELKEFKKS